MPLRLKSLELQGYKTFASRTRFEFAPTVTAIVGPNGSGKSNLSDALRWVLGEQSYSLLRARKTEDLIFSGSSQRARAGMASATITFDNAAGWLPIDFTEVAITRRAYRDGDNEYLLNGQRVRLKDITELLAQSGLAERTYTIIGQGLVDTALSLKAEERRRLFEEAAGISLHRNRREEALRRLDTTARNLERVEDILAELTPRLRSLERSARRAQEYEQVQADLRVVLREWYGYHWHRAQQELAEARELARSRELVLERARQEQADLAQKLSTYATDIQALRSRLADWHKQSAGYHTGRETLTRDLAVAEERGRSLGDACRSLEADLARLAEERDIYQEKLAGAAEELVQLEAEGAEARTQAAEAGQALQKQQAERGRVEKTLQAARQDLSSLTAQQAQLQARQAHTQAGQAHQKEQIEKEAGVLAQEEAALATAQAALKEAARREGEAHQAVQAAADSLQGVRQALGEVENRRKEALEQRAGLGAQAIRLRTQAEVLEGAEKNLTGYSAGARKIIQAARAGRLEGVQGALGSALEIPAGFETALAAALGDWSEAVLLTTGPQQALETLDRQSEQGVQGVLDQGYPGKGPDRRKPGSSQAVEEDEMGRAALLPLPDLRLAEGLPQLPVLEGLVGNAAALVKAPAGLKEALALLLGSVWVVRDRAAALRAVAALREAAQQMPAYDTHLRLVTLQGEIFYAAGPVVAGPAPQGQENRLARPRQLRELQAQGEEIARQAEALDGQIRALDEERGRLLSEERRLAQALQAAQASEERQRSTHREADLAVEKARRQLTWRREERQRLEEALRRSQDDLAAASARLGELEGSLAQARQKLRSLNEQISRALSLDENTTRLSHWETRLAVAERAAADAHKRQAERQAALEALVKSRSAQTERLAGVRAAQARLEDEKGRLRQEESLLAEQIEALRLQIEPAEAELLALEAKQSEQAAQEAAARQTLGLSEHHHAQARILLARRQEALDGLRRRIEDDFGLVAFEYAQDIPGQAPLPIDGMVEQLPVIHELSQAPGEMEEALKRQRAQLRRMGPINPEAQAEYQGVRERFDFLTTQVTDLTNALADIRKVIAELDEIMEREFRKTFEAVAREFHEIFTRLFDGGSARLVLTSDGERLTGETGSASTGGETAAESQNGRGEAGRREAGIEIEARLPGRRTQGLALLSGGERSLTATALVFALLKVSPTPFCVLDEVDAMLDEANVGRFRDLLSELSQNTQFLVVTHNRNTVQVADVIYGVTMGHDSASQVLSLKLDEVENVYTAE